METAARWRFAYYFLLIRNIMNRIDNFSINVRSMYIERAKVFTQGKRYRGCNY
jgi:hypothetical protein